MRRATGVDALFLGLETSTAHYHTLKLSIMDMSAEAGGYSFDAVRDFMAQRLHLLPPFRWKLLPSPLGLHHPLIIEDPDFDLDKHISRIQVPAPGDVKAMCSVVSEVAGEPLKRDRPLWEAYLLEGLEDGKVGFLLKIHHGIADGMANVLLMQQVFLPEPGTEPPQPPDHWQPDPVPSWLSRLGMDLREIPRAWRSQFPGIRKAMRQKKAEAASGEHAAEPTPPTFADAPITPWNHLLTARREFTCASFPFAAVLAVKSKFGVSVNDVVLGIMGGTLRNYLLELNALPDKHLVITMPVSTRTEDEMYPWGNKVAGVPVALRTDIADPVERLYAAREAVKLSMAHFEKNRELDISGVADLVPDFIGGSLMPRMIRSKVKKGSLPIACNLGISNVPGPKTPLYARDWKMESFYSAGMLNEGAGIGVTVWSYGDQFNFTFLTCPDLIPDGWAMIELLRSELAHMVELAAKREAAEA